MQYIKNIILLGIVFTLSACNTTRKNTLMPEDFFSKPSSVAIGKTGPAPKGSFTPTGAVGLLDFAVVTSANKSYSKKLESIDTEDLVEKFYLNKFSKLFKSKNFVVKIIDPAINKKSLAKSPVKSPEYALYDYRYLKNLHKTKYALILDLQAFGVERPYHSIIPLSNPLTFSKIMISLVDLEDNKIIAEFAGNLKKPIRGKWDIPGYGTSLESIRDNIANNFENSYPYFRGD